MKTTVEMNSLSFMALSSYLNSHETDIAEDINDYGDLRPLYIDFFDRDPRKQHQIAEDTLSDEDKKRFQAEAMRIVTAAGHNRSSSSFWKKVDEQYARLLMGFGRVGKTPHGVALYGDEESA